MSKTATSKGNVMTKCRRFHGEPVSRLIVSVPVTTIQEVDRLLKGARMIASVCRAEFVRQAIDEKLGRAKLAT